MNLVRLEAELRMPDGTEKITVVARGTDVLVREFELPANAALGWHHHSEVTDVFYGLEGTLVVETREPVARLEVNPGERTTVAPMTSHRTSNPTHRPCRFLLVQGPGVYDRIVDDATRRDLRARG